VPIAADQSVRIGITSAKASTGDGGVSIGSSSASKRISSRYLPSAKVPMVLLNRELCPRPKACLQASPLRLAAIVWYAERIRVGKPSAEIRDYSAVVRQAESHSGSPNW
jgi:hypothetical protein